MGGFSPSPKSSYQAVVSGQVPALGQLLGSTHGNCCADPLASGVESAVTSLLLSFKGPGGVARAAGAVVTSATTGESLSGAMSGATDAAGTK